MSAPKLELVDLHKFYDDGAVAAVDGVNLVVEERETVALLGSSGCGKSTTLNMIVGLERPSSGDVLIDGRSVIDRPPGERNVGLVFQDYAVFTHMTVGQNLAFGLRVRGVEKRQVARAVEEVAELLRLRDRLGARARELGGSELQRVAIGRTLITRPSILLLDEPLSNLEADARLATRRELRRLQKEVGLTIIYVTHDQVEALSLADRIAVMNAGKIVDVQDASAICERPGTTFVAGFLGSPPMNLIRGKLVAQGAGLDFERDGLLLPLAGVNVGGAKPGDIMTLGLRPDRLSLGPLGAGGLAGRVALVEPRGPEAVVTFETRALALKIVTPAAGRPTEGAEASLHADPASLVLFDGETGRRVAA